MPDSLLYNSPDALYLHIPYCLRKCPYCDFYSVVQEPPEAFLQALICELDAWAEIMPTTPLRTVYFGGGTPTRLKTSQLIALLSHIHDRFGLQSEAEITLEMNPESQQDLAALRRAGFNRLSLGLQTTDNAKLRKLGRLHAYEGFLKTYKVARAAGFENISIDLMVALPDQTLDDVALDLERILALEPEHISCYSLILEEGTPFGERLEQGVAPLPSDEVEREMVHQVTETLQAHGYVHYEISNYAKPGYRSAHNLNYWNILPYYAVGPGASAFVQGKRLMHPRDVTKYIATWNKAHDPFDCLVLEEQLSLEDAATELVIFQIRILDEGFSLSDYEARFGPLAPWRREVFERQVENGFMEWTGEGWRLTEQGADFADAIARELL